MLSLMVVLWCRATVISGLVRHKAMQGSQSIEDGCCCILGAVEHHQKELGIDQGPERLVGSRLEGVEQIDRSGNQGEEGCRGFDRRQGQQLLLRAPRLPFFDSPLPSYAPSTPFGFP